MDGKKPVVGVHFFNRSIDGTIRERALRYLPDELSKKIIDAPAVSRWPYRKR